MAQRIVLRALLCACWLTGAGSSLAARPLRSQKSGRAKPMGSYRDSLAPLPGVPRGASGTAAGRWPDDPARIPRPARGPWLGRYDLTTSEPQGDFPEDNYLASLISTGKRKPGWVNIGDGLGRMVLTPVVTAGRASGFKDALRRMAFCPFICAIGVTTGAGQVVYGVLKMVAADPWNLFRRDKTAP